MPVSSIARRYLWIFGICAGVVFLAAIWFIYRPRATLVVLGEDSSNIQAMEELKDSYEKANGVRIHFDKATFDQAYKGAYQDLSSGTGINDIILQYNFSLASFARNDYVLWKADLVKLIPDENQRTFEKDIFPNVWKEVGHYWMGAGPDLREEAVGYPFAANTMLLVYNKDLFNDPRHKQAYEAKYKEPLAPPKDWGQFRQIADYFSPKEGSTKGLCLQGKEGGWLYYEWCNFAFSMGGGVTKKKLGWQRDEHTPLIIDAPETVKATEFYLSLKSFDGSKDFFSTEASDQVERMKEGKIAMCIMWSDYVYGLVFGKKGTRPNESFGFEPIPGDKSMIAGGIYYVNKHSKHKVEAAKYIMHLMQKETQVKLMNKGLCSALRTAYDDKSVKDNLPYANALRQSLDEPRGISMLEAGPDADKIQEIITTHLQRLWKGEVKSAEVSLRSCRQDIEAARADIWKKIDKK